MLQEKVVHRERCPSCGVEGDGAADNLAVYDDGHVHCFACGFHRLEEGQETINKTESEMKPINFIPLVGECMAIKSRRLTKETCQKYNYQIGRMADGETCHIANYYRDGQLVGQKIRRRGKNFFVRGNMRDAPLMGQHLFKEGGKYLTVTEGELDALAMSQIFGNKWSAVSLPNGAASAVSAFKRNLEYLNSFEKVKICFDMDEPGQIAALACAKLLRPGKAQIVSLPLKDSCDCLMEGKTTELIRAWWDAPTYRPDGILHISEADISKDLEFSHIWPYPWASMTKQLFGRKSPELVMHSSGSGMGKSTFMRKLIYSDLQNGENVGVMMLEESVKDTIQHLMSSLLNKPVRQILAARSLNKKLVDGGFQAVDFGIEDNLSDSEFLEAYKKLCSKGNLYLLDHFGSLDAMTLVDKLDYMRTGLGCDKIYIDHISIIVSGMESGNERKDIDLLMTNLRQFVQRTDCHIDAVCHLTKPKGTPFEEGGQISLRDFRGSGALYQLSDVCLAYERNQQHSDDKIANTVIVRSLKDRFTGNTGIITAMRFEKDTGDLHEVDWGYDDNGKVIFDPDSDNPVSYDEVINTDDSQDFF